MSQNMFWRKTRAAIDAFHPLHRTLTYERFVSATLSATEWSSVLADMSRHAEVVKRRKWRLPRRADDVLVPMIKVVCADAGPNASIGVTADLRGPRAPGKSGPSQELPALGNIRKIVQWYAYDPWLAVQARLRDGSVLNVSVVDRIRYRQTHKVNPRGKRKIKTKPKKMLRIKAQRTLPQGKTVAQPPSPPPSWITVQIREGKRSAIKVTAKRTVKQQGAVPGSGVVKIADFLATRQKVPMLESEGGEIAEILAAVTEAFRWTPQRNAA